MAPPLPSLNPLARTKVSDPHRFLLGHEHVERSNRQLITHCLFGVRVLGAERDVFSQTDDTLSIRLYLDFTKGKTTVFIPTALALLLSYLTVS